MMIINPGTEKQDKHSESNAKKAASIFLKDLGFKDFLFKRVGNPDDRGFYDFVFTDGDFKIDVSFPGIDYNITRKGIPFESPRIYVDGSSWMWGLGLGMFDDKYKDYLISKKRE